MKRAIRPIEIEKSIFLKIVLKVRLYKFQTRDVLSIWSMNAESFHYKETANITFAIMTYDT